MPKTDTIAVAEPTVADLATALDAVRLKQREKQKRYSVLGVKEIQGTSTAGDSAERSSLLRDLNILHDQEEMLNEMLAQAQRRAESAMAVDKRDELGLLTLEYQKAERNVEQIVRAKLAPAVDAMKAALGEVRQAQRDSFALVRPIMKLAGGQRNSRMNENVRNTNVTPSLEMALAAFIRDHLLRLDMVSLDHHVTLRGTIHDLSIEDAIASDCEMHVRFMERLWSNADLLADIEDEITT